MTETQRDAHQPGRAHGVKRLTVAVVARLLALTLALALALPAVGRSQTAAAPASGTPATTDDKRPADATRPSAAAAAPPADTAKPAAPADAESAETTRYGVEIHGACEPPTAQEWVLIGTGTLVIFAVCFLLLVRVVQRSFINHDRNATTGRHAGISLTLLVGSFGMLALAYLITGCVHSQFLFWLCFPLALWAIHGLYTLIALRSE
jgi:thiol:disulfide interchange protein